MEGFRFSIIHKSTGMVWTAYGWRAVAVVGAFVLLHALIIYLAIRIAKEATKNNW